MRTWMLLMTLALAACGDKNDSGHDQADVAAGGQIFKMTCGGDYCHGPDGVSGSAPDFPDVVTTLSDEQIASVLENGQGYMPPQELSDEEVANVIAYLHATFDP